MAFHKSNFGAFGGGLHADMNGYIPEAEDGPFDLAYDHAERTHNADGTLTEYGEWWVEDRWPEIVAEAVKATAEAQESLREWQEQNA